MKLGIVGLSNTGKSTLFNAITNTYVESTKYPLCTIKPNIGVVPVPDHRLDELVKIYKPKKTTNALIEFVDIAGLVRGASKGEGFGNKFLSHIREVDAIVHVVRYFDDDNVVHVSGKIDPISDIETINYELIFADLEILEKKLEKIKKFVKNDKSLEQELELLERIIPQLENGISAKNIEYSKEEKIIIEQIPLLSMKSVIYVANIGEDLIDKDLNKHELFVKFKAYAEKEGSEVIPICAKIEAEIAEFEPEEKLQFLNDLKIKESGLNQLIRASYKLLGLISFLTAGPQEVRAWTIVKGTKARFAAGKIHSDLERGFIRAETIAYDDFMKYKNMLTAKEAGVVRSEGKDYEVKDGDIILFRFNV